MTEDTGYFLEASDVYKSFRMGKKTIQVLDGVNLQVRKGSWTALLGASGSGKTTLLNLLGTLERPDKGRIVCDGIEYSKLGSRQANRFRNERIGFIFQVLIPNAHQHPVSLFAFKPFFRINRRITFLPDHGCKSLDFFRLFYLTVPPKLHQPLQSSFES